MADQEMLNKIATAIFSEMEKHGIIAVNWNTEIARAAVIAMWEPTDEMIKHAKGLRLSTDEDTNTLITWKSLLTSILKE